MSFRWTHLIIYIIIYIIRLRLPLKGQKKKAEAEGKLGEKRRFLVIRDWGRRDVFWQRSRKGLIAFLMLI